MPHLIFHGHSCWEVEGENHRVLIDPFLTGNPKADVDANSFETLDAILVTHGHSDHMADVESIARKTGALVVSTNEVANYFGAKGCESHAMHIGGQRDFPFGHVKFTIAHHSSITDDGVALGNPAGVVFTIDGRKIYHAGDTAVFMDMKIIAELSGPIDVALLPIGDNFTMGIDEAVLAAEFVQARMNIPMHYNTWPLLEVNAGEFVERVRGLGLGAMIVEPGERYAI